MNTGRHDESVMIAAFGRATTVFMDSGLAAARRPGKTAVVS
jgi:hypothetical protein